MRDHDFQTVTYKRSRYPMHKKSRTRGLVDMIPKIFRLV